MKFDNQFFNQKTKEVYNELTHLYPENNILGVFLTGIANYGFAESESELQYTAVYLPTFDELCLGTSFFQNSENGWQMYYQGIPINVFDIRNFYNVANRHDLNTLEILFSSSSYINPKYGLIFLDDFISKKEIYARYNPKERIKKAYDRALSALKAGDIFDAYRLFYAATEYVNGANCEDCYHLKKDFYIKQLFEYKNLKEITSDQTMELLTNFNELVYRAADEAKIQVDGYIKKGIIDLMTAALRENVSTEAFLSVLTYSEKVALNHILSRIDKASGTANISISKIVEETNISRPVYKNLLVKMKDNGVAEIDNQGVKGTNIKIFDSNLLSL